MNIEKTKQDMIDKIYLEIANKELSNWCLVILKVEDVWYDPNWWNWWGWYWWEDVFVKWIYVNEDLALEQDKLWHYQIEYHDESYKNYTYHKIDIDKDVYCDYIYEDNLEEIIWHPVMIWCVLDYTEVKELLYEEDWTNIQEYIIEYWENKRLPIEEQSEECIKYIFNLIK